MTAAEANAADRRRSVEALAQALYEASDPDGVAWARRGRVIREPWLRLAEAQLARGEQSTAGGGPDGRGPPLSSERIA